MSEKYGDPDYERMCSEQDLRLREQLEQIRSHEQEQRQETASLIHAACYNTLERAGLITGPLVDSRAEEAMNWLSEGLEEYVRTGEVPVDWSIDQGY